MQAVSDIVDIPAGCTFRSGTSPDLQHRTLTKGPRIDGDLAHHILVIVMLADSHLPNFLIVCVHMSETCIDGEMPKKKMGPFDPSRTLSR